MFGESKKKPDCVECGNTLQLFELNADRQIKIMKCEDCSLYHIFAKDVFGGWKVKKVTKDPTHVPKI